MGSKFRRLFICFSVSLVGVALVNAVALGTEIVCDLALLGTSGKSPTNSIRALLFYVSRRILDPVAWIGGYEFRNFMLVSIAEATVVSLFMFVVFEIRSRINQQGRACAR